jgi:hypothetical protein
MKIYQNKKGPIFSINLYIFMVRIFFGLVCSGLVILLGGYKKFGAETPKKWRREQHLGWLEQSPSQWFMPKCFLCIAKVSTGQRSRCGEQTTRNEIILTIIKMSFFFSSSSPFGYILVARYKYNTIDILYTTWDVYNVIIWRGGETGDDQKKKRKTKI